MTNLTANNDKLRTATRRKAITRTTRKTIKTNKMKNKTNNQTNEN